MQEYSVAPKNRLQQRMTLCQSQKTQGQGIKDIPRLGATITGIPFGAGPGLSLHKQ